MAWLGDALRENPQLAVFLVLALGAAIGQVRWRGFQLGTALGCLLAGLVVGQAGIMVPAGMKDVFFLLFLFAVGLRTGAEFFRSLRSSAVAQLALTLLLVLTGFALTWLFVRAWNLEVKDLFLSLSTFYSGDTRPPNPDADTFDVGVLWSIRWTYRVRGRGVPRPYDFFTGGG